MTRTSKVLLGALGVVVLGVSALALALSHDSPCKAPAPVPAGRESMRAARYRCYGSPDVVKVERVAKPLPADNEVLIRIRAASVNPYDWHFMRGQPYVVRVSSGWGAPNDPSLGVDFAGTIEAVGKLVKRFKPGDEVFGAIFGALDGSFAEYATAREDGALVLKPSNASFEQAASMPIAAITALQGLRDHGRIRAGEKVLVNGAGGGVGTFAVEIAKAFGAEVTAVTSTGNLELVRSIGADHVVDYTREDFTRGANRYDLILDCSGNHPLSAYRRVMTSTATYVVVGQTGMGNWIGPFIGFGKSLVLSRFVSQRFVPVLADMNAKDLGTLGGLLQAGKVRPVIDRRYSLDQTAEALRYVETGRARGKVVITID